MKYLQETRGKVQLTALKLAGRRSWVRISTSVHLHVLPVDVQVLSRYSGSGYFLMFFLPLVRCVTQNSQRLIQSQQTLNSRFLLISSSLVCPAAPSIAGLPLWDGEREQCWRLHEEELPRNARVHAALQRTDNAWRSRHPKVRVQSPTGSSTLVLTDLRFCCTRDGTSFVCFWCSNKLLMISLHGNLD